MVGEEEYGEEEKEGTGYGHSEEVTGSCKGCAMGPLLNDLFHKEFMEVMIRVVAKLNISWPDPLAPPPSIFSRAFFFQGSAMQPISLPKQIPCCEDIKQQVWLSWGPLHQTRDPIQAFMGWSSIISEPELGYLNMPPLEHSVAAHLSSSSNKPQFLSKACQLTALLAENSYKAAGQVAAMTNNLAIFQAYQLA